MARSSSPTARRGWGTFPAQRIDSASRWSDHSQPLRPRYLWQRVGLYAGFCSGDPMSPSSRPWWPSISAGGYPTAPAAYPGFIGRAVLPLLGLAPGGVCKATRVTPSAGALLPHRFTLTCAAGEPARHRRSALCCTFLRVAPTGCYPAPRPTESGRSSDRCRRSGPVRGHPAGSLPSTSLGAEVS